MGKNQINWKVKASGSEQMNNNFTLEECEDGEPTGRKVKSMGHDRENDTRNQKQRRPPKSLHQR